MKTYLPIHIVLILAFLSILSPKVNGQDCPVDLEAPAILCFQGLQIEQSPARILYPSDFDAGTTDNCTPIEDLVFSFDSAGQEVELDISNWALGEYQVNLFVLDNAGFQSSCLTSFSVVECTGLSLACNDRVVVYLPESGEEEIITPFNILEGSFCESHAYSFSNDPADSTITITNSTPTGEQQVTVKDLTTGNSCWGTLQIVDCLSDTVPPVAICENLLQVSLGFGGQAVISAEIFNNGSYDLCGLGSLQVKRAEGDALCDFSDGVYGETVTFCCESIDTIQGVVLQVTDLAGNTNLCFIEVEVKDSFFCSSLKGKVFEDADCNFPGVRGLKNWIVTATGNGQVFQSITDDEGQYFIDLLPGDYSISTVPPQPYWDACMPSYDITILDVDTEIFLNMGQNPIVDCPLLSIDIERPFLRRCFDNKYVFEYCNEGTAAEENTFIDIQYAELLSVSFSSVPFDQTGDYSIRINLGELAAGECGSFFIDFKVSCDAVFGQTLCVKATIAPETICNTDMAWSGASLEASAVCTGDSVTLRIHNNGNGVMDEFERFYVIEEDIIIFMQSFNLSPGESITRTYDYTGQTYLIASPQEGGHPDDAWIIAGVESCNNENVDPDNLGFLNNYALNSGEYFGDVLCLEVIGAFDPNDKSALPEGYRDQHKILPNSRIDYTIRFQNTGTDTAFTVVVTDQIDPLLDLNTIRFGGSSHDYSIDIRNGRELVFTFNEIMLPDSNVNEPASNGFFKYSIRAADYAEIGDQVYNEAAIYFDFNEPIVTNQVFHTIDTNFIEIDLSTGLFPDIRKEEIVLVPNPAQQSVSFEWQGAQNATITFYNILGDEVFSRRTNSGQNRIDVSGFENGVYLMQVKEGRKVTHFSKFIKI